MTIVMIESMMNVCVTTVTTMVDVTKWTLRVMPMDNPWYVSEMHPIAKTALWPRSLQVAIATDVLRGPIAVSRSAMVMPPAQLDNFVTEASASIVVAPTMGRPSAEPMAKSMPMTVLLDVLGCRLP